MKPRRAFYIDGFNLFFGIKSLKNKRLYWLNIQNLCQRLTPSTQELVRIRYFTAKVKNPEEKRLRQKDYLQALSELPLISIDYGFYLNSPSKCFKCGNEFTKHSEKGSDVKLSVRLLTDAIDDIYDTAVIISGDSDLAPPVEALKKYFPQKRTVLFSPPNRHSKELKKKVDSFGGTIQTSMIRKCQFPDVVTLQSGHQLNRPAYWK